MDPENLMKMKIWFNAVCIQYVQKPRGNNFRVSNNIPNTGTCHNYTVWITKQQHYLSTWHCSFFGIQLWKCFGCLHHWNFTAHHTINITTNSDDDKMKVDEVTEKTVQYCRWMTSITQLQFCDCSQLNMIAGRTLEVEFAHEDKTEKNIHHGASSKPFTNCPWWGKLSSRLSKTIGGPDL